VRIECIDIVSPLFSPPTCLLLECGGELSDFLFT
jgi:hypothetical protein